MRNTEVVSLLRLMGVSLVGPATSGKPTNFAFADGSADQKAGVFFLSDRWVQERRQFVASGNRCPFSLSENR
jgi:prepilin-type processing-associated H-X9-DG protein